jgi:hypothetical protein
VVNASKATDANYFAATSADLTVTLEKAPQAALTLTGVPATAAYQSTFTVTPGGGSSSVALVVSTSGVCTAAGNDITMSAGTGTCTVKVNRAGDDNYLGATEVTAVAAASKIDQAVLTLTGVPATAAYQSSFTVTPGGGSSSAALVVSTGGVCTASGSVITMTGGTGTCTVKVNRAGDDNYNAATEVTGSATASKIDQAALTITAPSDATFATAATLTVSGGTTAGTVTYDKGTSTGCSISGSQLTVTNAGGTCSVTATMAGNGNYNPVTSAAHSVTLKKANTTTTSAAVSAAYSLTDQTVFLSATVSPVPGDGTVQFTVLDGVTPIGTAVSGNAATGTATASFTLPGGSSAGPYTVQAQFSGGVNTNAGSGTSILTVTPGNLLSDVAAADADFKKIDGFDVLFGKGSSSTLLKLKNTNAGTFHYQLTLTNETGVELHDKNVVINDKRGGSVMVYLTVPSLPTSVGTTMPTAAMPYTYAQNSAFTTQGGHPVHARPDDKTDDMPMTVRWLGALPSGYSQCSQVPDGSYTIGQPTDGTIVKCIKIEGMAIPRHGKARIDVNYEFALKNMDLWGSNAQTAFMAGFAFKSTTTVQLDATFPIASLANQIYTGNQATGLVGAGQQVTAVGGFIFDSFGNGVANATIKFYAAAQTSCTATTGLTTTVTTMADGFYFAPVAAGTRWWVGICSPTSPNSGSFLGGRLIDHKLAQKEFDEEDFNYVNP